MSFYFFEGSPEQAKAMEDQFFRRQYEKSMNMEEISKKFKAARKERGLTQEEVARRAGTTQSAVSRFESASRGASINLLARLAKALGSRVELG